MKIKLIIASIILSVVVSVPAFAHETRHLAVSPRSQVRFHLFYRTELYFGRKILDRGTVSDEEWEEFLLDVVTERFPRGFTVVDATGQYMLENDEVIREPTKILIILYPATERTASRRKIEDIRRAYVKRFKQESVLRLDFLNPIRVTF